VVTCALFSPSRPCHPSSCPSCWLRTHGAFTPKRNISASSIYFQSLPYQVDPATGLIDYDALEKNANLFKPKILICGASAYPRDFDYARLRKIADINGSYLMWVTRR
jgi:glycine hydroxymethyltransferase